MFEKKVIITCRHLHWIELSIQINLEIMAHQASLVAWTVKNLPARQESQVQSLGQEDPLAKGTATHSSILAWEISWTRGAWQATVHWVAKSQTWLSDWTRTYAGTAWSLAKDSMGPNLGLWRSFSLRLSLLSTSYFIHIKSYILLNFLKLYSTQLWSFTITFFFWFWILFLNCPLIMSVCWWLWGSSISRGTLMPSLSFLFHRCQWVT